MTNPLIPYSFTPGTKAKAQEVNANFNALADKIDENDSTTVHENTESNITGKKTFTKPIYSTVKENTTSGNLVIKGMADSNVTDAIIAMNTANKRCGSLRFSNQSGYNEVSIIAANEDGSTATSITLRNTNGTGYATCPTYTQNYADLSDKIVTTNFMANHWTTTKATTSSSASKARPAVVIQNYLNGTNWYLLMSDGFCIQGGRTSALSNGATINLLKPYANTNYNLTCQITGGTGTTLPGANYIGIPYNYTNKSFKIYLSYSIGAMEWIATGNIN